MKTALFLVMLAAPLAAQTSGLTTQVNAPAGTSLRKQPQSAAPAISAQKNAAAPDGDIILSPDKLASMVPTPRAKDVATPQALLAATYDVISGPPGPRDWDRFRSLFLPTARLCAAERSKKDGKDMVISMSVDDYIHLAGGQFNKIAFFERPIVSRFDTYARMAQVFSSYESASEKGGKPFARGINSFQMVFDGHRWWVASISWSEEDADHPLPPDMAKP